HHQVLAGEVEIELLEELQVAEILVGDRRDRDVVDVDLALLDQVQQQVERTFEDLELEAWIHASPRPTASRTSFIVAPGTARARRFPSAITSWTSAGLASISRRRCWIGFRSSITCRIMIFLHSRQPIAAVVQPRCT